MVTRSQITSAVYSKMGIKSDSTIFDLTATVIPKVQSYYESICSGNVTNILEQMRAYKAPFLRFLFRSEFFYNPTAPTLTTSASIGDVILNVDTSNLSASGWVLIEGQVIKYSGKTASTLTGLSPAVQLPIDGGTTVFQVFQLPVDLNKPFEAIQLKDERPVNFIDDR